MKASRVWAFVVVNGALATSAMAGTVLYGTIGDGSANSTLVTIDPATGVILSSIGSVGFTVNSINYDATTGILYGSTANGSPSNPRSLISINTLTGAGTVIGSFATGSDPVVTLTSNGAGQLYGWLEPGFDDLQSINKLTGVATSVGDAALGTGAHGLSFDSAGVLWLFNSDGRAYKINTATGAAAFQFNSGVLASLGDFNPDDGLYYGLGFQGNPLMYRINTTTGTQTTVGIDGRVHALTFAASAVPLPSAAWMGLGTLGVLGVAARLRRRKETSIV